MPSAARVPLVEEMAEIEYRLSAGTAEKLQLAALVAAFTHAKVAIVKGAK